MFGLYFCFCWFDCLWFLFRRLGVILFFVCLGWWEWDVGICFFLFLFNWFFFVGEFFGFLFFVGVGFCLFLLFIFAFTFGLDWNLECSVFYFGGIRDTCVFCFYFVFRGNLDQIFGWDVVLGDGEHVCFLFFWGEQIDVG